MPPVKKSKVFISYSRKDTPIADSLAKDLIAVGIDVWMDREDIEVGERWSTAIQHALESSQAMVLVLSPDSMSSRNVEDEFTYFLDNNKPIVPVMIRPSRLHFQLHRLQWIDFTGDKPDEAYERLLRALNQVGVEFRVPENAGDKSRFVGLIDNIYAEKRQAKQRRQLLSILGVVAVLALVVGIILLASMVLSGDDDNKSEGLEDVPAEVINFQTVPVFEMPSRDSKQISAKSDRFVAVKRRTSDSRFVLVTVGPEESKEGWILSEHIRFGGDITLERIKIFVPPTPTPSPTATVFLTATPTPTLTPTLEVPLNPSENSCIITVLSPAVARFRPDVTASGDFGDLALNEQFLADARKGLNWYYIGIGWINTDTGNFALNDAGLCGNLPENDTLLPNRLRPFLQKIDIVQELINNNNATPPPFPNVSSNEIEFQVEQAWQNYGVLVSTLSDLLTIDRGLLLAVIVEEALNTGGQNEMRIRFEADVFRRLIPKQDEADFFTFFEIDSSSTGVHRFRGDKLDPWIEYHNDPAIEWDAFEQALAINPDAALRAIRYGTTGILGNDHNLAGYNTPQEMFDAYMANPDNRIIGKLDYIKSNPNSLVNLRLQDWAAFSAIYPDTFVGPTLAAQAQAYFEAYRRLAGV